MDLLPFLLLATTTTPNPPLDFSPQRAISHVRALAALKSRTAGTTGESRAIRYIQSNLRALPLDVHTEPFPFRSYEWKQAQLRIGNATARPTRIVFDPYRQHSPINAPVAFIPAAKENGDISRKLVITTSGANQYRLASRNPSAIVYVSETDFAALQSTHAATAELQLKGKVKTNTSANLIATTRTGDPKHEIILSAHLDSAGTPGAQDNASGVAVLLELARILSAQNLPFRLRFVFFGAEEIGLIGSQAYRHRHREDLRNCELVFNIDSVGGKDIWIDMRGGVRTVPSPKPKSQLEASTDFHRWTLLQPPSITDDASNVPPWLQTAILDSARDLGYLINQGQGAGSDHRTFAAAGIVSTNIAIGGIKSHTPEDLPAQINPQSLERAARIVHSVVTRTPAARKPD